MRFSWLPRLIFRLASFLPVSSINGPNPLLLPASRPGPRSYENPLRMLEHGRRHRPAVAEVAELPATLAANGSAANVLGNVQCREKSYRPAAVLCWQVPDRLTGCA